MRELEDILAVLEDGRWHEEEEVARQVKLDDFRAGIFLEFLAEFGIIKLEGGKVKLSPRYLTFLREIKKVCLNHSGAT